MDYKRCSLATAQTLMMLPAFLFLGAVVVQSIQPLQYEPAHTAHRLVMWYAGRMWTLWVLLIAVPLVVLVIGFITLLRTCGVEQSAALDHTLAAIRANRAMQLIAAITVTAGAVLVIVIMHMLAN
jgi:hypothetical protein